MLNAIFSGSTRGNSKFAICAGITFEGIDKLNTHLKLEHGSKKTEVSTKNQPAAGVG
jgi:hypothetical protein